jgi:hypothetical protein
MTTTAPNPADCLPADVSIPFASLVTRIERIEQKLDVWLTKRRAVTLRPIEEAEDTTEFPTEPLDAGVTRTLARRPTEHLDAHLNRVLARRA